MSHGCNFDLEFRFCRRRMFGKYFQDKIKCLYVARKEAGETQNHLRVLETRKYLNPKNSNRLVNEYQGLIKGINAFINYIRDKQKAEKQKP